MNITTKTPKALAIYLLEILTRAVIYHLAARVGLKMAYVQINTSPVWPLTGIALAALLIFGCRVWPGISLGVLPVPISTGGANSSSNTPLGSVLGCAWA